MHLIPYLPVILFTAAGAFLSISKQKLTLAGGITGGILALMIFAGAGYTGLAMLAAFFILGTLTTNWKKKEKQHFKLISDQSVKRNAWQVLANGSIAAIAGFVILFVPAHKQLFNLMMAASLASATADTLSSELGIVYGRQFYNIITWKGEGRGLDGVISVEGTLIGLAGSMIIAIIYAIGFGWNITMLFIVAAGTIGNLSDSVLGALFERRRYIGNDMVNFLNTFIAALAAYFCAMVF